MRTLLFVLFVSASFVIHGQNRIVIDRDDLNRVTHIEYSGITVEYCYDVLGNRICRIISGNNQVAIDLAPTSGIITPAAAFLATPVDVSYNNENLGVDNSGSFNTLLVLSTNSIYESDEDVILRNVQTVNLAGGAMPRIIHTVTIPAGTADGDYFILVVVDPDNLLEELNETNNLLAIPIVVQACNNTLSLSTSAATASCGNTTSMTVTASGGEAPYEYEWSTTPVQQGSTATGLEAGIYTVTVTDAQGCLLIEEVEVLQGEVAPVANFGYSRDGLEVDFTNTSVGADGYVWDFGDGNSNTQTSPSYTYMAAGSYNVCLTTINTCGQDEICQNVVLSSVCPIPDNLRVSEVTTTSATLQWENDNENSTLDYRVAGSNTWQRSSTGTTEMLAIDGLSANTQYEWRVRSVCTGTITSWSSSAYFTTSADDAGGGSGDEVFKTFPVGSNHDDEQVALSEQGEIFHSWTEDDDFWVAKFDNEGEELWTKKVTGYDLRENHKIIATSDGGALCAIQIRDDARMGVLIKWREDGSLQWSRRIEYTNNLDTEVYSVVQSSGGYIGVGLVERLISVNNRSTRVESTMMFRLDQYGRLSWVKVATPNEDVDQRFTDVATDGIYVYGVGDVRRNGTELFLVKVTTVGGLLRQTGFRGGLNDRRTAGEVVAISNTISPDGANGIYIRSRSIIQSDANQGGYTITKLQQSNLNRQWSYSYESSSDGRLSIDPATGDLYVSHSDKISIIDFNGNMTANKELLNSTGMNSYDAVYNGSELLIQTYGSSEFGMIMASSELENTCALENDELVMGTDVPSTVASVMAGGWSTANYISAIAVTPSITDESKTTQDACGPVCEVTANINAVSSIMCIGGTQSIYSVSTGATALQWTNLTTGEDLSSSSSITFEAMTAGLTTIQLEASNGLDCSDVTTFDITTNARPSISVSTVDANCGQANGSAAVSASSGSSINWSTGQTSPSISGLSPGDYFVEVSRLGCTAFENFTIQNVASDLAVTTNSTPRQCFGVGNHEIQFDITGGREPFRLDWSNCPNPETFTDRFDIREVSENGELTLTITDAVGCSVMTTWDLVTPAALVLNVNETANTACDNPYNGAISASVDGGTPPYSYSWSGRDETTSGLIGLQMYDGLLTVMDANGCMITSNVSVADEGGSCATCDDGIHNGSEIGVDCGGDCQPCRLSVTVTVFLQGPYNSQTLLMNDDIRRQGCITLTEPFTAAGYAHQLNGGDEIIADSARVLTDNGSASIVDWVLLELRPANDISTVIASRSALLTRAGEVVAVDGISQPSFDVPPPGDYHLAVRSSNHLGVATVIPFTVDPSTIELVANFHDGTTPVYGGNTLIGLGGNRLGLRAGDANSDGQINAIDINNFWRLNNGTTTTPTNMSSDFNLDGTINAVDRNLYWRGNNSFGNGMD